MSDELNVRDPNEVPAVPRGGARRWLRDLAVVVVGGASVWVGVGWWRAPALPAVAPDFSLPTLAGGHVRLSEQQGHTVLLNFFATWCGPCEMELPTLTAYAQAHPETPIYYLAVDGAPAVLKAYAEAHDMPLSQVIRLDQPTHDLYGVTTLPTTVAVNADGSVRGAHGGILWWPLLWWWGR
jgi:thiol-disulfide isomerase/thioredoxin